MAFLLFKYYITLMRDSEFLEQKLKKKLPNNELLIFAGFGFDIAEEIRIG